MENDPRTNLLRSWKEISAYLQCDERTCHRWEQRFGMPVHRAEEGGSKSRVFAYKNELDEWFLATFTSSSGAARAKLLRRKALRWGLAGSALVVAAAVFLIVKIVTAPAPQPTDFAIRRSSLIALGEDAKELWRHDFGIDGLMDETFYRAHFQVVDSTFSGRRLPSLMIKDIDADGRNEVLFAVQKRDDSYGEGDIYCFSSRGEELWHFAAGREMRFGGRTYSPDYRIYGFVLHDIDRDGRQETVVISYHYPQWPCQLAVLDSEGSKRGEFWNSGFLTDLCFKDLDGDGREEMLATGVNNQYGGCLIVFDPANVNGFSPQSGEFKSDTLAQGTEKSYVLTPRTDVSLALGDIVQGIVHLGITGNKRLMLYGHYTLIFEFDFGLRCLAVDWGHGYMTKHNELAAAGKIHSALDEPYREKIKNAVRYWNGRAWVAEPTAVLESPEH